MKKTISINIAGLIFYIEEDGYDKLRQYIGSVHRYFSTFADSAEIVADIEGRIAERFLLKQKTENKQAISIEDVEELIRAMGSISDFEAAEHAEDLISEPLHTTRIKEEEMPPGGTGPAEAPPAEPRRKFFRDLKRKILGGVAAGIAHYYALDPLWVRLLLLVGIFGLVPFSGIFNLNLEENFVFLSGFLLISYIAMWIAFPGSTTLEDNTKVKKFYRDPERKVLGGVASGLSSYFNVDTGVIRFIWVISILFFGTGLLVYILLWAIAPAANTITEKMEMQGEPITLFNIDSNIRKNLSAGLGQAKESDVKRLLLLPFSIIGYILNAIGRILRELGPVVRVLIGVFMVGIAVLSLLTLLVCGTALLGMSNMPDFGVLPAEFLILKETPFLLIMSVATLLIVPVLVILFLGLMLLLKRKVVGSTVWIVLAGLGIFSIIGMISSGLVFQRNFVESGEFIQQSSFPLADNKTLLIDQEGEYSNKSLDLRVFLKGTVKKDSVLLERHFFARGASRTDARELASQIAYDVEKADSLLYFPNAPLISETLPYRKQYIEAVLEIPYRRPFALTRKFYFGFLDYDSNTRRNTNGFDMRHQDLNWENLRWAILPDSGLVCLNMPEKFRIAEDEEERPAESWEDNHSFRGISLGDRGEFVKQFAVPEFRGIDFGGAYHVLLKKGDQTTVTVDGSEANVEALGFKVEEGILRLEKLDKNADLPDPKKRIGVVITTPHLEFVELSGACVLKAEGFKDLKQLSVKLSGASLTEFDVDSDKMDLDLTGVSKMLLKGRTGDLKASLSGTCLLEAGESHIRNAEVRASGMSRAALGTVEKLDKRETGASRVSRRGE